MLFRCFSLPKKWKGAKYLHFSYLHFWWNTITFVTLLMLNGSIFLPTSVQAKDVSTESHVVLQRASSNASHLYHTLTPEDLERVQQGERVMMTRPLAGYPWPETKIYQFVKVRPDEVMAVFFDYNQAVHYVPNCEKSQITRQLNARTAEVNYCVKLPIFEDEEYIVRNHLSGTFSGCMMIRWRVLKATHIESSEGSFCVEPFRGGTLFCYTNLVKPCSKAAILLKTPALRQMEKTVQALVSEVYAQRDQHHAVLQQKIEHLKKAFDQEEVTES